MTDIIDLRRLRYFVAVAEHLHFGRAAQTLAVSQPPLSRQIQALEDDLGTPLLTRTQRSVKLTTAGAALLPEAKRLLRQAEALREQAGRAARGETGSLSLGFISTAAYNVLPELLMAYRRAHPGVKLSLQESTTDVQTALLRSGDLDVGLVLPPVDDPAIEYRPLFRDRLIVALPASMKEFHGSASGGIAIRSLAQAPFVLFPRKAAPGFHDQIVGFCQRAGFSPRVEQEATQMQTIVSLVAGGMGVALVPSTMSQLQRTGVVYRQLADKAPEFEMGLAWKRGSALATAQAFIALAQSLKKARR